MIFRHNLSSQWRQVLHASVRVSMAISEDESFCLVGGIGLSSCWLNRRPWRGFVLSASGYKAARENSSVRRC